MITFYFIIESYGNIRPPSPYLNETDEIKLHKRSIILKKIILNEFNYIQILQEFVSHVITPFNLKDTPFKKTITSDPSVAVSFNILYEILKISNNFHNSIKNSNSNNQQIAETYKYLSPSLQLYAQYASENAKLLNIIKSNSRQLNSIVPEHYNLEYVLIQPLEHYLSYSILFQEYVWLCPSYTSTMDSNTLDMSLGHIISQTTIIDNRIIEEQSNWKLLKLQSQCKASSSSSSSSSSPSSSSSSYICV